MILDLGMANVIAFTKTLVTLLISLTLMSQDTFSTNEVKYVGCMKRTSGSLAFTDKVQKEDIDIKSCIQHCWERRKTFCGLQSGSQCFCSTTLNDVVTVAEKECYKRCNKDCEQICGGETTLSVYKTGYRREPTSPMKAETLIKANIGCYDKYKSLNVLCPKDFAPLMTIRMTSPLCVHYCNSVHDAKFSTTVDKETCCCSNSVSGARNTRLDWCNMRCRGDKTNEIGCMGVHRGLIVVATIQLKRLSGLKKWPSSTFTNADWLAPIFPASEDFRKKDKPLTSGLEDDPSLSGLLIKKLVNQPPIGNASELTIGVLGDQAVVSLEGGDKREKPSGGVGNSVAVSEVSGKKEATEPDRDEGNTIIIGVVVVCFVIIVISSGFYFFRTNHKTEVGAVDDDSD